MKKILLCFVFFLFCFGLKSLNVFADYDPDATEYYINFKSFYSDGSNVIECDVNFVVNDNAKPLIVAGSNAYVIYGYKEGHTAIGYPLEKTTGVRTQSVAYGYSEWNNTTLPALSYPYNNYQILDTNLPLFASNEDALNYFLNGDDSGLLNKDIPLKSATLDDDLNLIKLKWTPHSIDPKKFLEEPKAKIEWDYKNEYEGSFMVIETEGTLYRSFYIEIGNKWVLGGNPLKGKANVYNRNDGLLASDKQLEYYLEMRDRFARAFGITDSTYSYLPKYFWVTRYAMVDGQLYRSRCYRIEINHDNSISTGRSENGTEDSNSDNWTEDPTDEYFEDGQNSIGGVEVDKDPSKSWEDGLNDMNSDDMLLTFINTMKNLKTTLGEFPALVASVFGYLPNYIITFLALGILLVIILRIIGR